MIKTVFGYSFKPACGCRGKTNGGFFVTVDNKGTLVYKTYLFDTIEQTKTIIQMSEQAFNSLKYALKQYAPTIQELPNRVDRPVYDGDINTFVFNDKSIETANMIHTGSLYRTEIERQECILSQLFTIVSGILEQAGIHVMLTRVVLYK